MQVDVESIPELTRIVADGDLDGLIAAAILRTLFPQTEVHFTHPAALRAGLLDEIIDRNTAICDLPFHPNCGLYLDHHLTNRPSSTEQSNFASDGGLCIWEDKPSAARVAYDLVSGHCDLSHITPLMPMVDKLDSGQITMDEYLSDDPVLWLSRSIDMNDIPFIMNLMDNIVSGSSLEDLMKNPDVQQKILIRRTKMELLRNDLEQFGYVDNRLAIVRLENTGHRSNGYLVTAHFGNKCDACCIIHGWTDGSIETADRPALSASFYCNSFLHSEKGVFDLTRLATMYDETGGGHANACGCRIQPLDETGALENRIVEDSDISRNIKGWMLEWSKRTNG